MNLFQHNSIDQLLRYNYKYYLLASILLGISYSLFFLYYDAKLNLIAPAAFTLVVLACYWLLSQGKFYLSSGIYSFAIWLAPAWCVLFSGGKESPLLLWLIPQVLIASSIREAKWAVIMLILSLFYAVFLFYFAPLSLTSLNEFPKQDDYTALLFLSFISATAILSYFSFITIRSLRNSQEKVFKTNARLEHLVETKSQELIQKEKMAALGADACQIVHNLNNPLTIAIGNVQILKQDPNQSEAISRIEKSLNRFGEVITDILKEANDNAPEPFREFQIEELMKNQLDYCDSISELYPGLIVKTDFEGVSLLKGVPSHFDQMLDNLVKNALQSMKDSPDKVLTLRTKETSNFIELIVIDTGCGVAPKSLAKIFDPSFSTKNIGDISQTSGGNGLGLPSVKKLVESYQGEIEVQSTLEVGSKFTLRFPKNKRS